MSETETVSAHWHRGNLFGTLCAALREAGLDPEKITVADLAPLDHMHGRGSEATEDLFGGLDIRPEHRVIDIGSGVGGPARHAAATFGCRVSGVDLTAEFCEVAAELTRRTGLADRVDFHHASALELPFEDAVFDRAYTQNVVMNIADKRTFFSEAFRVLKPGGLFAAVELAEGGGGPPLYPVPWADDPSTSHLTPPDGIRDVLEESGFEIVSFEDTTAVMLDSYARARARIAAEGRPVLGVHLVLGDNGIDKIRNSAQSVEEGRTVPITAICRKP